MDTTLIVEPRSTTRTVSNITSIQYFYPDVPVLTGSDTLNIYMGIVEGLSDLLSVVVKRASTHF